MLATRPARTALLGALLALGLGACVAPAAGIDPGPPLELRASVAGTVEVVADRPLER